MKQEELWKAYKSDLLFPHRCLVFDCDFEAKDVDELKKHLETHKKEELIRNLITWVAVYHGDG